ncbi:hypothetical protein SELMODRAFT_408975 [Selaginella moellendorffii]|uniref:Uncharacterized protein n=1 Tax=Selaginella moellendorffii TaxID=88036 RepID=D8R926_SELML|nr:hypothetical protein SELMODRAFT_408975 [Selaginella moellendorffii]
MKRLAVTPHLWRIIFFFSLGGNPNHARLSKEKGLSMLSCTLLDDNLNSTSSNSRLVSVCENSKDRLSTSLVVKKSQDDDWISASSAAYVVAYLLEDEREAVLQRIMRV